MSVNNVSKIFLFFLLLQISAGVGQQNAAAEEYGGGPIVFIKPVRAVIFEHKVHLGKQIGCRSCHPDLFAAKAGAVEEEEDFTMASFRQGKYCGKCHDGTNAFSSDTRCNWCHIGVQGHKHLEEYELGIK